MDDLKELRLAKNFTQCQVAKFVGISECFYSQIENKQRNPSVKTAKKIAELLDFDWTTFFENKNIKEGK